MRTRWLGTLRRSNHAASTATGDALPPSPEPVPGLTVGGVRRRLRRGLETIGEYLEHGRATGRRAVHGLAWWLSWRHLDQLIQRSNGPSLDQVLQAGMVAVMTVAATAILITHHASPAPAAHTHRTTHIAAVGSSSHAVAQVKDTTLAAAAAPQVASVPVANVVHQATSVATVQIKVQVPELLPVRLPSAPSL